MNQPAEQKSTARKRTVARSSGKSASPAIASPKARREPPQSAKAIATYEKLITAAGELLGEVGFEKLTTNGICARANLTPPALYRYFDDKYEILEELARRLLKRQYDAYAVWLFDGGAWASLDSQVDKLEEWFRTAASIVASEPGGVWTMRALRALPNLAHVRIESQRMFTDQMFEFYKRALPDLPENTLWYRLRIRAEFGFVVDELAIEENEIPHSILFREAARLIARSLYD
ncbi:TetR/AcrR family transcriptional regulator [Novosphingobium sp. FSW06-99]|uniref:TetR/AcrR family transcriptional regulator n=1 Tax=Novosphingobium sp. FSW06-99 TaxID=1739113 RepID=UPI0009EAC5D9|nr:TetR/AcrR family transcriptional regulator [Novosphingobium sp. FSW06-99]